MEPEITLEEIEEKMRELERLFLDKTLVSLPPSLGMSPFSPLPSLEKQYQKLKMEMDQPPEEKDKQTLQGKLPQVECPMFDGQDLESFVRNFSRFLRLTGLVHASDMVKRDWLINSMSAKVKRTLERINDEVSSFDELFDRLQRLFPKIENDVTIRNLMQKVPVLPKEPHQNELEQIIIELDELFSRLSNESMSDQDKLLILVSKVHTQMWKEIRQDKIYKLRCDTFDHFKEVLREKVSEDYLERYLYTQKRDQFTGKLNVMKTPHSSTSPSSAMNSNASFSSPNAQNDSS